MRYRTTISFAGLLLAAAAFAGCGKVENGVCTAEQDDKIDCTVDLCDFDSKSWAHIPDDDLCDMGQRCDPTAGCVAAGLLSGHAFLLGHTDHSGITVSVDGIENGSTMTAADGSWSLPGLPPGMYKLNFTKDKFFPQSQAGVTVTVQAAATAQDVTLTHGEDQLPTTKLSNWYDIWWTPDQKTMVFWFDTPFGYGAFAQKADGSKPAVPLTYNGNGGALSNTHLVWTTMNDDFQVWSVPLDGSAAPKRIFYLPPINPIYVYQFSVIHAGTYATIYLRYYDYNTGYTNYRIWGVKQDGTGTQPAAPLFQTVSNVSQVRWVVANDTHALWGILDPATAQTTPIHRGDLASNTEAGLAPPGGGTWYYETGPYISPDGQWVAGYLIDNSPSWERGFLIPISAAPLNAAGQYGVDEGAASSGTEYSDRVWTFGQWLADSSAFVYNTPNYTNVSAVVKGGDLKAWFPNVATPISLAPINTYYNYAISIYGHAAFYRDQSANNLRVVSVQGTTPTPINLQNTGNSVTDMWVSTAPAGSLTPTSAYVVWVEGTGAGSGTRSKLWATSLTYPITAAAPVQLGAASNPVTATCNLAAELVNTSFFWLCRDTGTLTAFTASNGTAAGTATGVDGNVFFGNGPGDRLIFSKAGGLFSATPATVGSPASLTTKGNSYSGVYSGGPWVFINDTSTQLVRVSKADGSAVDEPLFGCQMQTNPYVEYATGMNLFMPIWCGTDQQKLMHVPASHLP